MRKEICCVLRMVYHWQNSVVACVTMFHPEMSQAEGRGRSFSLSQSTGPSWKQTNLPSYHCIGFEPQALLSFIHLFWGKEELRKTKAKTKGREISGQILVSGFTSSGVSISLLLSSWRHSKMPWFLSLPTCYMLKKNKKGTERKIFIIQD